MLLIVKTWWPRSIEFKVWKRAVANEMYTPVISKEQFIPRSLLSTRPQQNFSGNFFVVYQSFMFHIYICLLREVFFRFILAHFLIHLHCDSVVPILQKF